MINMIDAHINDPMHLLVHAHVYLQRPKPERKKFAESRPGHREPWYVKVRQSGYGKECPTCETIMRPLNEDHPDAGTVEHIIPLSMGGKNDASGPYPNCVPMCNACNQARNKVMKDHGRTMALAKFLVLQVYGKMKELNQTYLKSFNLHLHRFKTKPITTKRSSKLQNPVYSAGRSQSHYGPNTIQTTSRYDLRHRNSVVGLRNCFDAVWKSHDTVHYTHLHPCVHKTWFPFKEDGTRTSTRSKKKVKNWIALYLSGQISETTFINEFNTK